MLGPIAGAMSSIERSAPGSKARLAYGFMKGVAELGSCPNAPNRPPSLLTRQLAGGIDRPVNGQTLAPP